MYDTNNNNNCNCALKLLKKAASRTDQSNLVQPTLLYINPHNFCNVGIGVDQPLDLSIKRKKNSNSGNNFINNNLSSPSVSPPSLSSSTTTTPTPIPPALTDIRRLARPTVIKNGSFQRRNSCDDDEKEIAGVKELRCDVSEHFLRSLNGKWPRVASANTTAGSAFRQESLISNENSRKGNAMTGAKGVKQNQETRMKTDRKSNLSAKIIVNNSGIEIEDHFRKALGREKYESLRRNRS